MLVGAACGFAPVGSARVELLVRDVDPPSACAQVELELHNRYDHAVVVSLEVIRIRDQASEAPLPAVAEVLLEAGELRPVARSCSQMECEHRGDVADLRLLGVRPYRP